MEEKYKIDFLIDELININSDLGKINIPKDYKEKRRLLRILMNITMPWNISDKFIEIQDKLLAEEIIEKGINTIDDLNSAGIVVADKRIILWKGDITTLEVDGIVNAANSELLGCFIPCHGCIDNAIHSHAGIQLRQECYEIMKKQGHTEATGSAKITEGYNLPCKYILHTVGPIVQESLNKELCDDLKSCYESCLRLATENKLKSIAFCCISTGEFKFPNEEAAKIAIDTVERYFMENNSCIEKVIFNVYKEKDYEIYKRLLR